MKYNERGKSRIEVSDILNYFKDIDSYYNDCTRYDTLKRMLEDIVAETKEDAERKKGMWLYLDKDKRFFHPHIVKCSVCNNTLDMYGVNAGRGDANFCPNCGAEMEGQDDRK